MRLTDQYNPAVLFLCFLSAVSVTMFSQNPFITVISLTGSVVFFQLLRIRHAGTTHLFSLCFFLILSLINPIFSKSGVTVLFFFNNRPITFEALFYGMNTAGAVTATLYWFYCFFDVMTSDKLLYVFSRLSKKLSLALTMALRFTPLFLRQYRRIRDTQKALGLLVTDNIIDAIKGRLRVLDILITWALEGGIITAQSMESRGYNTGRRTFYSRYRFTLRDLLLLLLCVLCAALSFIAVKQADFRFYPAVSHACHALILCGYAAFAILSFLPALILIKEAIRWKFLQSRI